MASAIGATAPLGKRGQSASTRRVSMLEDAFSLHLDWRKVSCRPCGRMWGAYDSKSIWRATAGETRVKHKAHREARSLGRNWEAVTCLVAEGTSMRTCYVTPAYSGLDEMNARGKASTCATSLPTSPRRSTKRANLNTKAIGKHSVSSYPRLSGAPGPARRRAWSG